MNPDVLHPPPLPDRPAWTGAGLPYPFLRAQLDDLRPAVALTLGSPIVSTDAWSGRHLGRLTDGRWAPMTGGAAWHRAPVWDGARLSAYVSDDPAAEEWSRRYLTLSVAHAPPVTGGPTPPTGHADPGHIRLPPGVRVDGTAPDPEDASRTALLLRRGPARRVMLLSDEAPRHLDAPVTAVGPWLSRDELVLVVESWPGRRLCGWDVGTGVLRTLVDGGGAGVVGDCVRDGERIAVTWTSVDQPRRLYIFDRLSLATRERPVLPLDEPVGPTPPAPYSLVVTTGAGHRSPCLVHPADGPPRGTVVLLHGGPNGAHHDTWSPLGDSLALLGWRVIRPNVRGSSVIDPAARPPAPQRYGVDDAADVVEVIRQVAVGPVVVGGVSYGGYLAARTARLRPVKGVFSLSGFIKLADLADSAHPDVRAFLRSTANRLVEDVDPADVPHFIAHGRDDTRIPSEAVGAHEAALPAGSRVVMINGEGHGITTDRAARTAFSALFSWLDEIV